MKIRLSKIIFNILSYLSDKTGGNPFFVKYKLMIGVFLLGATPVIAQDTIPVNEEPPINDMRITCYKPSIPFIETKGKIVSSTNTPIQNVAVTVKRTSLSTQSEENGNFEVETRVGDTLVFALDGYETQEVAVRDLTKKDSIIIIMTPLDASIQSDDVSQNPQPTTK